MKYSVIGGDPFTMYTGTVSFTGLKVVGIAETEQEALKLIEDNNEDCGGLMLVIDLQTGMPAKGMPFGSDN